MANKKEHYPKKSLNGEPNPHMKQSQTNGAEQSIGDSLIEYNQPESSPYESPIITVRIGRRTYRIPVCYIRNYPQFSISPPYEPHYILSEVDEEVGHTVVHFLCTGNYETLRTTSEPGVSKMAIEYRRSMLVYQAAREHDLYDLETYAKKYIEMFGESMSIFEKMEAAREIYSKLPQDETWLDSHINKQLRIAFSQDTNIFQREDFYDGVGKDPIFDKAVMRMVVNIYSEVLSRQVTESTPEEDCVEEDCAAEDGAVEAVAVEEGVEEDCAVEDGAVEAVAAEEGVEEDCAVEDGAVEAVAVEEGVVDNGAGEEGAAEDAVNLEFPAEPLGSTFSFEWGENGTVKFSAPNKEIKWKKGKGKKKKSKEKNKKKEKEKVEELAEPVGLV